MLLNEKYFPFFKKKEDRIYIVLVAQASKII